jgi:hypothetical protein
MTVNTDVLSESIIYCSDARDLPGKITKKQLDRWRTEGLKIRRGAKAGETITLEWASHGGRPATSEEALERFFRRVNGEVVE